MNRPSLGEAEIAAVADCLRSRWITTGALCKTFEEKFQGLTGAKYAVSLTSGTAGMDILLTALGIGKGDEVITPSLTFASTVNMIALHGARPVFVDIDYDTLNINADAIEALITPRTRAIIPVHFGGAPADMEKIQEIARRHNLIVIEDAAHAVGTRYRGIHAGGFGEIAIFSFHPIKNITTGEGGLITHNNDELERKLRLLRFHGIERDAWKRYGKGGNPEYDIEAPGWKYNMTDLQAALGNAQFDRLDEFNRRRAGIVAAYEEGLRNVQGIELTIDPAYPHEHAHHLFVVKILAMKRELFMAKLSDYNIGYGLHFPPCHLLKYVRERYGLVSLPATERAADKIISLPLFPEMTDDDVLYVCEAIKEITAACKMPPGGRGEEARKGL
ncbi:MAG: DegT/DnrJ/EryC1/StrS family aminotransferase [Syntrophales bacterium]